MLGIVEHDTARASDVVCSSVAIVPDNRRHSHRPWRSATIDTDNAWALHGW